MGALVRVRIRLTETTNPATKALLAQAWQVASVQVWRDHDHTAEDVLLDVFADPTEQNQRAAEEAVALLQRRYDHVLRRLDGGDGDIPPYPLHQHNAAQHPADCLDAVLDELAGARLDDRAGTLAHGRAAAHALEQRAEAPDGSPQHCGTSSPPTRVDASTPTSGCGHPRPSATRTPRSDHQVAPTARV